MKSIKFQAAFADEKKAGLPPAFVGTMQVPDDKSPTAVEDCKTRFKCSEGLIVSGFVKWAVIRCQQYIRGEIEKLREAKQEIVPAAIQKLVDEFTVETTISRGAGSKATIADMMVWLYSAENAEAKAAFDELAKSEGFETAKVKFLPVFKESIVEDEE